MRKQRPQWAIHRLATEIARLGEDALEVSTAEFENWKRTLKPWTKGGASFIDTDFGRVELVVRP